MAENCEGCKLTGRCPEHPAHGRLRLRDVAAEDVFTLLSCRASPQCERKVRPSVMYCCGACEHAHKHRYEIDQHSVACDERWAERRKKLGYIDG